MKYQVAMKACPYRADFYSKLSEDPEGGVPVSEEKLHTELDKWLAGLLAIVTRIEAFYKKGGYGEGF
jgi:hypothetical protein